MKEFFRSAGSVAAAIVATLLVVFVIGFAVWLVGLWPLPAATRTDDAATKALEKATARLAELEKSMQKTQKTTADVAARLQEAVTMEKEKAEAKEKDMDAVIVRKGAAGTVGVAEGTESGVTKAFDIPVLSDEELEKLQRAAAEAAAERATKKVLEQKFFRSRQ